MFIRKQSHAPESSAILNLSKRHALARGHCGRYMTIKTLMGQGATAQKIKNIKRGEGDGGYSQLEGDGA